MNVSTGATEECTPTKQKSRRISKRTWGMQYRLGVGGGKRNLWEDDEGRFTGENKALSLESNQSQLQLENKGWVDKERGTNNKNKTKQMK